MVEMAYVYFFIGFLFSLVALGNFIANGKDYTAFHLAVTVIIMLIWPIFIVLVLVATARNILR